VDATTFWRSGLIQAAAVTVLSLALAVTLPHAFFEDWGWLAGPGAWLACATLTARLVGLPIGPVLLGAVLAGIPSALAVLAGVHWLGVAVAIGIFAAWCARLAVRGGRVAWT
jgi:hypothetical protein